jgi:hypothetical protein
MKRRSSNAVVAIAQSPVKKRVSLLKRGVDAHIKEGRRECFIERRKSLVAWNSWSIIFAIFRQGQ